MPGAYPTYPNTPEGNREFNFWQNLRVTALGGCTLTILAAVEVSDWSVPAACIVGIVVPIASAWTVFRFNLGGRLFAWASPAAEDRT